MSISNIEEKLYHTNFRTEDSRLRCYLSVHATLLRNKEVPRAYIPNILNSEQQGCSLIGQLLHSDINKIVEETNKDLALIHISTKSIQDLKHDDKNELLSMLENLLLDGWGSGKVHYEYLRIMPSNNCELTKWISHQPFSNETCSFLKTVLKKRLIDSKILQEEFDQNFPPGNRNYHPTILSKSFQLLLEKQWKNNWAHHSNYLLPNEKSFSNLLLIEDL
jgi:hypothetical protein